MTVKITKPAINLREKLSELDKETGLKGEELLRSETAEEAREALELSNYDLLDVDTDGNLNFGDNEKAVFGDGSDLQIYHDGSHSRIYDSGGGELKIMSNGNAVRIQRDNGESMILANTDGAVNLYYNNAEKLATTPTGVDVTGTVTADGLTVDRQSTDGDIAVFRKDGTTVGSIGTYGNTTFIQSGSAASYVGLLFNGSQVEPTKTSGASGGDPRSNGTVALGSTGYRFTDLYLSGGVYLGGTGAANKLDDYEEGEYDATMTPSTSGTITLKTASDRLSYTKIGDMVHVQGLLEIASVSSPVGTVVFIPLPFTPVNATDLSGRSSVTVTTSLGGNGSVLGGYVPEAASTFLFFVDASTIVTNNQFYISFAYKAA